MERSSKKAIKPVSGLLRDVFKGRSVTSISRGDARELVDMLQALPKSMGHRKELKDLSVKEAIKQGKKLGLPTIAPKTINDGYLMHISSMFNWARKEQWVTSNPFEGLSVHDPVDNADRRDPFTIEQLNTLFGAGLWERPWAKDKRRAGDFWVPLLCLFHGLRLGEAAGLRVADIEDVDGISLMHLRSYDGHKLKTTESRGTLPLHPKLLELGFIAYVAERREGANGDVLLFPDGC